MPGTHAKIPSRHAHVIMGLGEGHEALFDVVQVPSARQRASVFSALLSGSQEAPAVVRRNGTLHGLHVFLKPLGAKTILGARCSGLVSSVSVFRTWGAAQATSLSRE